MKRALVPLLLVGASACARELPPKTTPSPVESVPLPVDPSPVPSGQGRVFLDTPDGPAHVYVIAGEASETITGRQEIVSQDDRGRWKSRYENYSITSHAETFSPLCKTPCAADLPLGVHRLYLFSAQLANPLEVDGDRVVVTVDKSPTIYRHAMGSHESSRSTLTRVVVDTVFILLGAGLTGLGAGLLVSSVTKPNPTQPEVQAGDAVLGGGVLLLAAGIVYTLVTLPTEQNGASWQSTPK